MPSAVIAVSGASGSGKSTLTSALAEVIFRETGRSPVIFAADRYFKKDLPKMISPADGKEYPDWNSPDSFDSAALTADLAEAKDSGPDGEFILVEGVTIYCVPELRKLFDVKIFVDAAIEMRIFRRIARNVVTKGQTIEFIGDYYLKCARYREKQFCLPSAVYADFHVDNEYGFDADAVFDEIMKIKAAKKAE